MAKETARGQVPLYVAYKGLARERFLGALEVADYGEISLFSLLCSFVQHAGSPSVDARDFLTAVAAWARTNQKPELMGRAGRQRLAALLDKLERNALVEVERREGAPVRFTLKEQTGRTAAGTKALRAVERRFQAIREDPAQRYPRSGDFEIPPEIVFTVPYEKLNRPFVEEFFEENKIVQIRFSDDLDIVITPELVGVLPEVARGKIDWFLANSTALRDFLVAELRKLLPAGRNFNQEHLKAHLAGTATPDPLFWIYLALAANASRGKGLVEPRLRPLATDFFISTYLLHAWWQYEYEQEKIRKQREADARHLLTVMQLKHRVFTLEELADLRDRQGQPLREKYPDVRQFLEETLAMQREQARQAGGIPVLIELGERLIHREALAPVLFSRLARAAEHCDHYFRSRWHEEIAAGELDDPTMRSDEAFARAVGEQITRHFPVLAALLKRPHTVHGVITELAQSDAALLKRHRVLFRGLGDPTFKRLDRMLSLNRTEMLEAIVATLPLLRRFMVRRRLRNLIERPGRETRRVGAESPAGARGRAGGLAGGGAGASGPGGKPGGAAQAADLDTGDAGRGAGLRGRRRGRPETVKVQRPRRRKPGSAAPAARRRRSEPRNMDEAVDKFREALTKKRKR